MDKIFDSVNNFSSRQTQAGGGIFAVRDGICAALSALWCMHMLEGKRDLLTKPSYERAQALQVKYRWDSSPVGQDYLNLLEGIGLKGSIGFSDSATNIALSQVAANPGAYHLSMIGYHTVAACVRGEKFYFYDCDANGAGGLYLLDDLAELKQLVNQHYAGQRFLGIKVTL